MKKIKLFVLITLLFGNLLVFAQDIENSKDHPILSRYPGSEIVYYEEQQFKPYKIAVGPVTGYRTIGDWIETEGKETRIYYELKGETTVTEVYRNYMTALKKGAATILASGIFDEANRSKEVGGRSFLETVYITNPAPTNSGIRLNVGSSTSAGSCYIAAVVEKPGAKTYIVIGGAQYSTDIKVFLVDIIEETIMEDDLIQLNADEMLSGIQADGKVALYGLFFDFDKATLQEASNETLEQIAILLKNNSQLNVFVVGHTDMKGSLDYNLKLSKQRAETVVNTLVNKYGISASRLSPEGVGPLSPVSTNIIEDGRKLNRRVELVEK
ncbi:MAG TPA: OmpA family protein [Bacteroidales bacterium]